MRALGPQLAWQPPPMRGIAPHLAARPPPLNNPQMNPLPGLSAQNVPGMHPTGAQPQRPGDYLHPDLFWPLLTAPMLLLFPPKASGMVVFEG